MELLVIACALLVLVSAVAWHAVDTLWARRLMVRRRVLVQLRTGAAIEGTLWATRGRKTVLRGAQLHEPGAEPQPMDGTVVLDRDSVDWIQSAAA
jgi:hypothetical protein